MFIVDDLVSWLTGRLADFGYQKVSTRLRGSEQDRALKQAVTVAVQATTAEMSPSDEKHASQLAEQISGAFGKRIPVRLPSGQLTRLEALRAGIAGQLSVLEDAVTSATGLLGVPTDVVADRLTAHLICEISARGAGGGPLEPLANQLDHDLTHSQLEELKAMVDRLLGTVGASVWPSRALRPAGWPLEEVTDPFALEVHRPVQPDKPDAGLPVLPEYMLRDHDMVLAKVVAAAAAGRSGIAVLVGGSSTGKTRACWEALALLRGREPSWQLWHPIDPSWPEAALQGLPHIEPRTVVWLNEAQFYLDAPSGLGEQVAAGLRELLRHQGRAPVLVLATLWPSNWSMLTTRPEAGSDPHAQARELLANRDIRVPAAFTPGQVQRMRQTADPRLAEAAGAEDGRVIQYLAGAPELLARYRHAPPAAKALIEASMDARRLGMPPAVPLAFLAAAAPGYITSTDWDQLGDDWLELALANATKLCRGARGPLTRLRPRPASPRLGGTGGSAYQLADYLDQAGRRIRQEEMPPGSFWDAAATCGHPGDLVGLGDAAYDRGLYQYAAQLHKNATAAGNADAAVVLIQHMGQLYPDDPRPADFAVAHVGLKDAHGLAKLLEELRGAGAHDQAGALLARDPAAHASLDDGFGVDMLVDALQEAGAHDQAAALVIRAANHADLEDPDNVWWLLGKLRETGEDDEVEALLARNPAARTALDDPFLIGLLLQELQEAGAHDQARTLAARAAADADLKDPGDVAALLKALRGAGADDGVEALLARNPAAQASLDGYPTDMASLLRELRETRTHDQAQVLLARDPAGHISLDRDLGSLLQELRKARAHDQAVALATRAVDHADLQNPGYVAWLLKPLQRAGVHDQAQALATRAADHADLEDPGMVAWLLRVLREAGAHGQVQVLLARNPAAHTRLDHSAAVASLLEELRKAGADGQVQVLLARNPANRTPLDYPYAAARLLEELRKAGAYDQVQTLLARDPATHIPLDDHAATLLRQLREAGGHDQADQLMNRLPAAGMFGLYRQHKQQANRFRFGRDPTGDPARPWAWPDLH